MILKSISIIKAPKILPKIKDFEVFVARWVALERFISCVCLYVIIHTVFRFERFFTHITLIKFFPSVGDN